MTTHFQQQNQAAFEQALQLAKHGEKSFLALGRLLLKLMDADKALFRQAYEQSGIGRRTAYGLAQIARAFAGLPVSDEDLATIGSTRALILAPHVNAQNCSVLVAMAATTSTRDLKIVTEGGEPIAGSKALVLYLPPQDHDRFIKAALAHGAVADGVAIHGKEEALMKMLTVVEGLGA